MNWDARLLRYLQEHTLIGIRVGPDRVDFVDIWMVEVSGRLFARSWNRSTRGWYGALSKGSPATCASVIARFRSSEEDWIPNRL
ncbi:MAG: hypothetical protein R3E12_01165 [Candidatus Eisenbacteria bacterium]